MRVLRTTGAAAQPHLTGAEGELGISGTGRVEQTDAYYNEDGDSVSLSPEGLKKQMAAGMIRLSLICAGRPQWQNCSSRIVKSANMSRLTWPLSGVFLPRGPFTGLQRGPMAAYM